MSRVGRRVLTLPKDVELNIKNNLVEIKGKLGVLTFNVNPLIAIEVENHEVKTIRANEEKHTKQLHGTTNSIIENMIIGVSKGFKKELEIKGVGYKSALKGSQIEIAAGYSHLVYVNVPKELKVEIPKPTQIIISGIDNQKVGELAAVIRKVRTPNPYSGKGIMYKGEVIRRKEGKAAGK
ncbi:50S ribosomal protein L6 [[Mycoplasma] mobile]|uniref:50S ribosomal protein L6 n=1 Tax=Mycoplasma mobile (strain ATCC 43663 / 163K / NCTC 11711) TaxID=267748 RepID=Q6KI40_MYCM1|nr:50S ribosomal protein L6 [[Mycoplasma] mobile]AAT27736.1 50S ribosomal protein l6 [Mycoplasma mobile 163K]